MDADLSNPILMYHGVSSARSRRFSRFVVPPERFEEQMAFLAESGFKVYGVSDLLHARRTGLEAGVRAVAVTFDDAFRELLDEAVPVLERFGFGATVYVPTAYIGGSSRWLDGIGEGDRPVLDANELRELVKAGIECGSHSHTHPALDVLRDEAARKEIELSKRLLEEAIGRDVATFAYPFGYESGSVRALVADAGYSSACRVNYAMSPRSEDLYGLSRLPVTGDCTLESFAALVQGRASLRGSRALARAWRPLRRGAARSRRLLPGSPL